MSSDSPLDGEVVVDLSTGIPGAYATKVLADGGADVLKVEAPSGDPLRRWSASGAAITEGEDGALFQYLACSKRSVVAAPEPDGIAFVRRLLPGASTVVWSPGSALAEHAELSPQAMRVAAPNANVVAITPFGLTGPWAGRAASEATISALSGGPGTYRGDLSYPPVLAGGRLTDWTGGMMAAIGALTARYRSLRTGAGELVDVSLLESAILTQTMYAVTFESVAGVPFKKHRTATIPDIHPTKDGYVGFMLVTGQQWLDFCVLVDRPEWMTDESLIRLAVRNERYDELIEHIEEWTRARTTDEIVEHAALLRIPVAHVGNGATVPHLAHFQDGGWYVRNPRGGFLQPDVPYTLSAGSGRRSFAPAPRLGEHTDAVKSKPPAPMRAPAREEGAGQLAHTSPFAGLRVVELTAFWAGPVVGNILGMLGADVIHVESAQRPDGMRFNTIKQLGDDAWWEWSPMFQGANTDKRSLTLDLSTKEGRALCQRLIATADLVVENYSPRVLDEWGFDYNVLQRENPGLIMLRMPAFGLRGPWRDHVGYAQTMEQISGLSWISGQPDRLPVTLYGPADPIGGCHGLIAALLALEHRRRTGQGMLVESPQIGGALNMAAEQVIEHSAYGALLERDGNRSPWAAPQGTYLCNDVADDGVQDTWVVISVESDDQWARLRAALGSPAWADDPDLDTHAGRRSAAARLDEELAAWCAGRPADEVVSTLLAAGVPAAPVIAAHESAGFDHLWQRGFFERVTHPLTGDNVHSGFSAQFSAGPRTWHRRPAPRLGEHNRELLLELGLTEADVDRLYDAGIIGTQAGGGGKAW